MEAVDIIGWVAMILKRKEIILLFSVILWRIQDILLGSLVIQMVILTKTVWHSTMEMRLYQDMSMNHVLLITGPYVNWKVILVFGSVTPKETLL
ncbi:hypothetical protein C0J52_07245 [Blattella germanica]|nr:hypothetical protein C0J52_07245 [Blattella germanica]